MDLLWKYLTIKPLSFYKCQSLGPSRCPTGDCFLVSSFHCGVVAVERLSMYLGHSKRRSRQGM